MKVAVITRTKDRGILLERAIKSIHQQTLSDFVHVIINDGGDPSIVDALVKKYDRIIKGRVNVIHNDSSNGMEAASNIAIKSVDSEYIAIHDDDDSWHPRFLEEMVSYIEGTGVEGAIARTERIYEEINGDAVKVTERDEYMPHLSHFSLYDLFAENFAVPISFLYKRRVFEKIGYYDEELRVTGDWNFALRFMRHYDIDKVDPGYALAFYHIRPHSTGVMGNSIFDPAKTHVKYHTMLANKFLREDLDKHSLGFGYLFNVGSAERGRDWTQQAMQKSIDELKQQINNQAHIIDQIRFNPQRIAGHVKSRIKESLKNIKARIKG